MSRLGPHLTNGGQSPICSPRIVFSDMDGTFLATNKSIPPENLRVLDELASRGIPFVPCTGRPVSAVPQELLAHEATRFAVGSNGAVVFDVACQQNLHVVAMDKDRVLQLYSLVSEWGVQTTFDVFADGEVYSERARYEAMGSYGIDAPSLAVLRRVRKPVDMTVPQIVGAADMVEKITCFWRGERDRDALAQAIVQVGRFSSAHGHPKNFELQAEGVSKGSALAWLCSHVGIPQAAAMAFGDEANDLPMLEAAGVGVAMANATPEVLAQADCATTSSDEAGVATFLRKLLATNRGHPLSGC